MIENKDITFICAGKIFTKHHLTLNCLKSIRKYFPQSKIILSTWQDENISGLENFYDGIILNQSPKSVGSACVPECSWYPKENSYNHQQLCVSKALEYCNTPYTVKFRTDFVFNNNKFIKYYEEFLDILGCKAKFFKQKVVIYSYGTLNPLVDKIPLPQHPSDLFFMGLTDDIKSLYDGRYISDEIANYYTNHQDEKNPCLFNHLYTPEQFLWLQFLDKSGVTYKKPKNYFDISDDICNETIKFFIENFIVFDPAHLGFTSKFDKIFGYKKERTEKYAVALGYAVQLTNIIRDVGEDAKINRIYIPKLDMESFGVKEEDILRLKDNRRTKALLFFETQKAQELFIQAEKLLPKEDFKAMLPARAMGNTYKAILAKLIARPCRLGDKKIKLSKIEKIKILFNTWRNRL